LFAHDPATLARLNGRRGKRWSVIALMALLLSGCGETEQSQAGAASASAPIMQGVPWYTADQVAEGGHLYADNCAVCHGQRGEGASNWRERGPDGRFPPPPLNGTGHAWHHPLRALYTVIKSGSPGGQSNMPAWDGKLSDAQIVATIAWFQSNWPTDIYDAWHQRDQQSRARTP
jgi:mono/diheme cytochrome c family protein